ncbi:SWIM zinc finger family protein [Saccharibacillus sp. CPCC 101409]|uniref:SWIM zinc finger family protein n=1 Tax=Saccharibacillus sp. CPCC 101409 TaxID=3058041 RepID=UPI002673467D|nr:SWIM zinc finger family protein [Saccharibacillus sp. CPCC 101409]MDO3409866.1 SWIM zinc finger family protein [Saccharibacillus sp. CPCC 101409]
MLELTASYIDSLAPNAAAVKNGRGLVAQKKFVKLNKSEEGDLLFGECSGSGKSNYVCSVDFVAPDNPVSRCSCPSRQFPCKHALGLMYAYADGLTFETSSVPEDISSKREKAEKREENKAKKATEEADAKPKKVNKSALKKKVSRQLEALDELEKLTLSLVRGGLGTADARTAKNLNEHAKRLGSSYLTGAENELRRLALLLENESDRERSYTYAAEQLTLLHAFIKKGRSYLQAKLEDPELAPDSESTIEEWLGHAWQLSELKEAGRVSEDVELLQLAFYSYKDDARREYIDTGFWLELGGEAIHRTVQYRPFKAVKHMKQEDSFFNVAKIGELYRYPGGLNARVRFEGLLPRKTESADLQAVRSSARSSIADAVKAVKNQLKDPLADRAPVVLLKASRIAQTEDGGFALVDEAGDTLALGDVYRLPQGSTSLLALTESSLLEDCCVLAMFEHRMDTGRLVAQPLTLIQGERITRLLY